MLRGRAGGPAAAGSLRPHPSTFPSIHPSTVMTLSLAPAANPPATRTSATRTSAARTPAAKSKGSDPPIGAATKGRSIAPARSRNRLLLQRNRRVETYRDLVRPLAIHYARCSRESSQDLIQVGMLGLIRAAELFRSDRATPFEVFARPHIRGAILHYLRDVAPCVRLPRRQAELQERLTKLRQRCQADPQQGASPEELRRRLGVDAEQWRLLLQHRQMNRPGPLDAEQFAAVPAPTQELPMATSGSGPASVEALLAVLEPRQRWVVRQVVLAGWSYRRLGVEMNVSPMTVQRLLRRGLDRLRQHLDGAELSSGIPADLFASGSRAC